MRLHKYILYGIVAMLAVGCTVGEVTSPGDIQLPSVKPTVPLKRRPIVPTTKLPRPRAVEVWQEADGVVVVEFACGVSCAVVRVVDCVTGSSNSYVVDGGVLELRDIVVGECEIEIEVDGATALYRVDEL